MRVIIEIRDEIIPEVALEKVLRVIRDGRVSGNNDHYCWVTCWDNLRIQVVTRQKRSPKSADSFIVLRY